MSRPSKLRPRIAALTLRDADQPADGRPLSLIGANA